jgi:tripartite-type tricarboxylate transporter receptor subunit TctC
MKLPLHRLIFAFAFAWSCATGHAEYPDRPVRLVMPFAAGGASDAVARSIGPALAARLGQPVVIENHPGAQGALAGQMVATAPADGYTLLYAISATAALPVVTHTTYDMTKDFTPVSTLGTFEFGMFVSGKLPTHDVREFVAYAKAHPGALNYATLNLGEQYAAASFMEQAGIRMVHVPYRSMAQILPDIVSGQVHVNFGPLINGAALAKDGRVRVLATLSEERSAQAPDVPTLREAGLSRVSFESVQMLYAPAKTPKEIVEKLSREVNLVLDAPEVREQLRKVGLKPRGSTPEAMRRSQAAADETWARLARNYRLGVD